MAYGSMTIAIAANSMLPFFWLAVRGGKAWAKWILLVSFAGDIPLALADPLKCGPDHLPLTALAFVCILVETAAFYFCLRAMRGPGFTGKTQSGVR